MNYRSLVIASFLMLAISTAVAGSPPSNTAIVPGKAAGAIALGQPLSSAERRLHHARSVEDVAMGRKWKVWTIDRHGGTIGVFCRRPDEHTFVIERIRTTSARYAAAGRVSVGTAWATVQKRYPEAALIKTYHSDKRQRDVLVYDSLRQGIAFEVPATSPLATRKCSAITIHAPLTGFIPIDDEPGGW